MGKVVGRSEAEESKCICYKIDKNKPPTPDNLLCHSKGVLGTLRGGQGKELCTERLVVPSPTGREEVFNKFSLMGSVMDVCAESDVSKSEFGRCIEDGGTLIDKGYSKGEIEDALSSQYGVEVD